ncbi:MAG TPA: CsbD family protein [Candidatus Dormibacteraeota bacterium]|nr:CsbD family protein [Candidatus Dormibacteraeota bacterium]
MKDQVKGKAEEVHGKLTGDKGEELKGKAHQAVDKVKRTGRDVRDDVQQEGDKHRDEAERERQAEPVAERRSY